MSAFKVAVLKNINQARDVTRIGLLLKDGWLYRITKSLYMSAVPVMY